MCCVLYILYLAHKNEDPRFGPDFPITASTLKNYDNLYEHFTHGATYVTSDLCFPLFEKAGIHNTILRKLFNIVDIQKTGQLSREQFYGFVYLSTIYQQTEFLKGYIPSSIPEKLLPLSLRNNQNKYIYI